MKRCLLLTVVLVSLTPEFIFGDKKHKQCCNCSKDFNYEVREERVKQILSNDWAIYEQKLKQVLASFPNNTHNLVIEKLLRLLDAEMVLVDNLIRGISGHAMECAMHERNMQMRKATPDVVSVYEKIMNLATFDERLYPEYKNQWKRRPTNDISVKLGRHEMRSFLENVRFVLGNYYDQFSNVQYGKFAKESSLNNEISTDVELAHWCPIVR